MANTSADDGRIPDIGRLARLVDAFRIFRNSDIVYSFRSQPLVVVSFSVSMIMVVAAVLAPLITPQNPFNPAELELMDAFTEPMSTSIMTDTYYVLGADGQGRDMYSAILYGTRISLFVGVSAVLFAMILGTTLGLYAGYRGGWPDGLLMRIADVQLTFPNILLALLIFGIISGMLPAGDRREAALIVLIVSIGLSDWPQYARTVRGATMVEKSKEYVEASRVIGLPVWAILFRHILPNVMRPVLVIGTIGLALAIIAEATLSFLGVGMPPTQPSLGTLIRVGQDYMFSGEWWIVVFPAVALLVLALSVNLLGDWLRDVLNPKLR